VVDLFEDSSMDEDENENENENENLAEVCFCLIKEKK
jgi:hypothetical protein